MTPRRLAAAAALILLLGAGHGAGAQTGAPHPPAQKKPPRSKFTKPGPNETPLMSAGHIEQTSPGEYLLTEEVDFRYGNAHLLADKLTYSESERKVTAEGNVVIELGQTQVSGDRADVSLDSEDAVILGARAYIDPDLIVDAEKMERVSEDSYRVTNATLTSCTQPTPYWSFWVGTAIVHVGHYAHLRNTLLRIGKVPIFWSPYLAVPIKEDRAAGLLFPHFGFTQKRGAFISNALYVPIGRSVDATLQIDSYAGALSGDVEELPQTGLGLETRFVPSQYGSGTLTAYFLRERLRPAPHADVVDRDRYQLRMNHTQNLPAGFKLLVDIDTVSDLNYFIDFEREIRYSSNPTVFSQIDFSRQSGPYAVNVRFNRQVQFIDVVDPINLKIEDLSLYRLPEVEMRGRGIRLGTSRFYLTYQASFDGLVRRVQTFDPNENEQVQQTTYDRLDFFPTITGSFSPFPWLDVSPILAFRDTFYSASDSDPNAPLNPNGPAVNRQQYHVGFSVVGPRLFRIFGKDEERATRYKSTFEPRVTYDYVPQVVGGEKIIPFDEIDTALGTSNIVTYSITSRLFQKKPPQPSKVQPGAAALTGSFASLVLGEEAPTKNQNLIPPAPDAATLSLQEAQPVPPPPEPSAPPAASAPGGGAAVPPPPGGEAYVPSDVSTGPSKRTPLFGAPQAPPHALNVGPVEIASFELAQGYSLDDIRPLSRSVSLDANSPFSPVTATIRVNPTYTSSFDLRAGYDILFHDINSVSLSGTVRTPKASYMRLSWVYGRDLEGVAANSTTACIPDGNRLVGREGPNEERCFNNSSQIHFLGGTALLGRKLTGDVEIAYDVQNSFIQNQRYRFGYNTQCCGILVEVAKRTLPTGNLGANSDIQYRFVLNLRGVGTFLDVNGRPQ